MVCLLEQLFSLTWHEELVLRRWREGLIVNLFKKGDKEEPGNYRGTSVKIIKNEVRCRDDTMPKTVDTRKHCKVGLRACNNLPQPPKTKM